jgi:hypothetical protein
MCFNTYLGKKVSLWNGVMTMTAPGVTGEDTFDGEVATFEDTMLLERFYAILGAGGGIPALIAYQRRNTPLIDAY